MHFLSLLDCPRVYAERVHIHESRLEVVSRTKHIWERMRLHYLQDSSCAEGKEVTAAIVGEGLLSMQRCTVQVDPSACPHNVAVPIIVVFSSMLIK